MKEKIRALLKKRNAIMLAHNYQPPEIQDLADLCGDSLELSIRAASTEADVIVFCGVHFMAETASILSPHKTVLLPRHDAGCLMADMITAEGLKAKIASLPPMPVVTYVNSTADVKALSTICCTSANVVTVANSLDAKEMLMTPDRNLAMYAASQTTKKIHVWEGYCPTHERLTPKDVRSPVMRTPKRCSWHIPSADRKFSNWPTLSPPHPECFAMPGNQTPKRLLSEQRQGCFIRFEKPIQTNSFSRLRKK